MVSVIVLKVLPMSEGLENRQRLAGAHRFERIRLALDRGLEDWWVKGVSDRCPDVVVVQA